MNKKLSDKKVFKIVKKVIAKKNIYEKRCPVLYKSEDSPNNILLGCKDGSFDNCLMYHGILQAMKKASFPTSLDKGELELKMKDFLDGKPNKPSIFDTKFNKDDGRIYGRTGTDESACNYGLTPTEKHD
jgi:hypothetical protein